MNKEKREVIIITDNGIIAVPGNERMSVSEIADLFGIYYRTAKRHIRAIQKSNIAQGDVSMSGAVEGRNIYPDYYGLDMIIVLAFRIQSKNATLFREWLMEKVSVDHFYPKNNLSYFSLN